jgi:hypothetical protein
VDGDDDKRNKFICVGLEIQNGRLFYTIKATNWIDTEQRDRVIGWYAVDIFGHQIYDTIPEWRLIYGDPLNKRWIDSETNNKLLSLQDAIILASSSSGENIPYCRFEGLEFYDKAIYYLINALDESIEEVKTRYAIEIFGENVYMLLPDISNGRELIFEMRGQ